MKILSTLLLILTVTFSHSFVSAYDVYHWVDEKGVAHYSQNKPPDSVDDVRKLQLEDTAPTDFDPEEDRYGVEQQAERMAGLRDEMQKRREEARERQRTAPQPPLVIYQQHYQPYSNRLWLPPLYPWPPVRPEPPIAVPYRSPFLAPPGG
jgi:hypothetical protein